MAARSQVQLLVYFEHAEKESSNEAKRISEKDGYNVCSVVYQLALSERVRGEERRDQVRQRKDHHSERGKSV